MPDYQISVITPFHNCDMDLFEGAARSMEGQTLGFANIEWIIVVHNCEPEYLPMLQARVGHYPNVVLHVLNNDRRTASSPRNRGLTLATAPYVGFLDGDDRYTPDCLKAALTQIRRADARMALFRMEYELVDAASEPVPDLVLWNQCDDRVIMERGSWDEEKMFSGMFGWVTSRLFERAFLQENDLFFDEEVVLFEDFHFFLRAISRTDRVVYLPNTIGYHYMINGASTLQSKKTGETLVRYARGLHKLYADIEAANIHTDFIQRSCFMLSYMILKSDDVTEDERRIIKELLAPFVTKFDVLPANKLRSPEQAELYCRFSREVILNTAEPIKNVHVKESLDGLYALLSILRKNADTDFGRAHDFAHITSIEEYREKVPLMEPEDLAKLVRLQTNIGEQQVLTAQRPALYFINGFGERIPSIPGHFPAYAKAFTGTMAGKLNLLLIYRRTLDGFSNDRAITGDMPTLLSGTYFYTCHFPHKKRAVRFASSTGRYFEEYSTREDCYYHMMLDGILNREVEQITALTTTDVLIAFQTILHRQDRLVADVAAVDPDRAAEVKMAIAHRDTVPLAKALWPNCRRILAFGAGEFFMDTRSMKDYTGDIPHNHGYYYTEEAILGQAVADDCDLFQKPVISNDFYELMGVDDRVISLSDAEVGKSYHIIVTNPCGLYRYTTHHFIRIEDKDPLNLYYRIY